MDEITTITEQLSVSADDWLNSHLSNFDPLVFESGAMKQIRRKAFIEMAMMVYIDERLGDQNRHKGFRDLLVERANERHYYELLLRNPSKLRFHGPALVYAHALNELQQPATRALESAMGRDSAWAVERKPCALIDVSHLCKLAGRPDIAPKMRAVIEFGAQCNPPGIIESELKTVYALTHDVLFWHHFGFEHPEYPSETTPGNADDRYRGLVLRYLAEENYDIVLELVLCGVLQRALSPTTVRVVLKIVLDSTEEAGYVPGPDMDESGLISAGVDEISEAEISDTAETEWRKNYHTNLVATVAARIIDHHWERFLAETSRPTHNCTARELEELGSVLKAFAKYDLKTGASRLTDVADSRVAEAFPDVIADTVAFLKDQRNQNGNYGYWTDERLLFEASEDRTGSFEADLVEPIAEECETAIQTFENR
ncbi:DUF6895 family protein [Halorussus amylolyticus]|uniref:DUF6895 family protein n=1 Tax=Halorussus amylolyticus TaxID=1126242 RepID=UPI00104B9948|nr:hypothetical protein [Halorussus amylolyticus]